MINSMDNDQTRDTMIPLDEMNLTNHEVYVAQRPGPESNCCVSCLSGLNKFIWQN